MPIVGIRSCTQQASTWVEGKVCSVLEGFKVLEKAHWPNKYFPAGVKIVTISDLILEGNIRVSS